MSTGIQELFESQAGQKKIADGVTNVADVFGADERNEDSLRAAIVRYLEILPSNPDLARESLLKEAQSSLGLDEDATYILRANIHDVFDFPIVFLKGQGANESVASQNEQLSPSLS